MDFQYATIEEALTCLKEGKIILVTDDPDRENEGDFICAGARRKTSILWRHTARD